MKVLWISNWKNLSGWSQQAVNSIIALDTINGIEVVPRHINILNNVNPDLPERLKELEDRSDSNPDVVVYNTLPHLMEYTSKIRKNIGYFVCESNNFKATGWANQLNLMNENWVPCYHNKKAATASNVRTNINIVPEAVNIEKFTKTYPTHKVKEVFKDDYVFYTIAEWTTRKNLEAILKAFHLEFNFAEPVQLFIKTNIDQNNVNQKLEEVKKDLRTYNDIRFFKKECVQSGFVPEEAINSIHQSADCYVSASHCEAWDISCMDAMGFGNSIIAPNYGGYQDYLTEKNAFLLSGVEDYIWRAPDAGLPGIYTSKEKWYYPTIASLREQMRAAYTKSDLVKKKKQQGLQDIKKFSYQAVGKIMEQCLVDKHTGDYR